MAKSIPARAQRDDTGALAQTWRTNRAGSPDRERRRTVVDEPEDPTVGQPEQVFENILEWSPGGRELVVGVRPVAVEPEELGLRGGYKICPVYQRMSESLNVIRESLNRYTANVELKNLRALALELGKDRSILDARRRNVLEQRITKLVFKANNLLGRKRVETYSEADTFNARLSSAKPSAVKRISDLERLVNVSTVELVGELAKRSSYLTPELSRSEHKEVARQERLYGKSAAAGLKKQFLERNLEGLRRDYSPLIHSTKLQELALIEGEADPEIAKIVTKLNKLKSGIEGFNRTLKSLEIDAIIVSIPPNFKQLSYLPLVA